MNKVEVHKACHPIMRLSQIFYANTLFIQWITKSDHSISHWGHRYLDFVRLDEKEEEGRGGICLGARSEALGHNTLAGSQGSSNTPSLWLIGFIHC